MSLQRRDEIVIGGQSTITYLSYTTAILSKEYDETTTATRTSTSQSIEYYPSLTIDLPNPTGTLTAYTTTITATFTPVVYASVTAAPLIIPGVSHDVLFPKIWAVIFGCAGLLLGWGSVLMLSLLGHGVRKCRARRRERRAGLVGEGRDEPRCDVPNGAGCDVPKPPPGYVEEFEMA